MPVGRGCAVNYFFSVYKNLSRVRLQKTENHFHGGGFAGTVFTDKAEDTMLRNGQIQPVQNGFVAKPLA